MNHSSQIHGMERTADQSAWRIHAFQSATSVASLVAGALLGAMVGATFGALAGLPGIWTGALLGALAGAAAGRVMFVQEARASQHDAELDETIGVTSRNLGRPPIADIPEWASFGNAVGEMRKAPVLPVARAHRTA